MQNLEPKTQDLIITYTEDMVKEFLNIPSMVEAVKSTGAEFNYGKNQFDALEYSNQLAYLRGGWKAFSKIYHKSTRNPVQIRTPLNEEKTKLQMAFEGLRKSMDSIKEIGEENLERLSELDDKCGQISKYELNAKLMQERIDALETVNMQSQLKINVLASKADHMQKKIALQDEALNTAKLIIDVMSPNVVLGEVMLDMLKRFNSAVKVILKY